MTDAPYQENTPEYRVWRLAQRESGLPDNEVLTLIGYLPHDGTSKDLLGQYRREAAEADHRAAAISGHAANWAFHQQQTALPTARAYGTHVASEFRAGRLDLHTQHPDVFPGWLAEPCGQPG